MTTSLVTRARLKLKKIARELTEPPEERQWRAIWPLIDPIEGWLLQNEGRWLYDASRSLPRGANIVEIGSYKGRSTCCLSIGARRVNGKVFAIDSFDGGPGLPTADSLTDFRANIERRDLSKSIEVIAGLSGEVAKTWTTPIHLLFIDGSHAYDDVLTDFAGFFPHVVSNGIVAFHDLLNKDWPDVARVWNEHAKTNLTGVGYCGTLGFGRKSSS